MMTELPFLNYPNGVFPRLSCSWSSLQFAVIYMLNCSVLMWQPCTDLPAATVAGCLLQCSLKQQHGNFRLDNTVRGDLASVLAPCLITYRLKRTEASAFVFSSTWERLLEETDETLSPCFFLLLYTGLVAVCRYWCHRAVFQLLSSSQCEYNII